MLVRLVVLMLGFVVAALLVTLAVANRHGVPLVLDPFNPQDPVVSIELPFFFFLLGTLIIGVILGGIATWLSQSKWRRTARNRTQEALRWKGEAERLSRERDARVIESKQLAAYGR